MSRISVGEIAVPGERFPQLCLTIDGKRYRIEGADASRFGRGLAEAARWAVARADPDVLRPFVCDAEITEL